MVSASQSRVPLAKQKEFPESLGASAIPRSVSATAAFELPLFKQDPAQNHVSARICIIQRKRLLHEFERSFHR